MLRDGGVTCTGTYSGLGNDGSLLVNIDRKGVKSFYTAEIIELIGYKDSAL